MDWLQGVVDLKLSDILVFLYVESVFFLCSLSYQMVAAERYKDR